MQAATYQRNTATRTNISEQIEWLTQYIATGQHLRLPQRQNAVAQHTNNSRNSAAAATQSSSTTISSSVSTVTAATVPVHSSACMTDEELIDLTELDESVHTLLTPAKDVEINVVDLCNTSLEELQTLYTDTCTQHIETLQQLVETGRDHPQYSVIEQSVRDIDNKRLQLKSSIEQLRKSLTPSKADSSDMPALESAVSPQFELPMAASDTSVQVIDNTAQQRLQFGTAHTASFDSHTSSNAALPSYMTDTTPINTYKSAYQATNTTFNATASAPAYNSVSTAPMVIDNSSSTVRGPNFAPPAHAGTSGAALTSTPIRTVHGSGESDITRWTTTRFPWTDQIYKLNKEVFGNNSFRKHQREVINAAMSKQDVLVLMPTGGGT